MNKRIRFLVTSLVLSLGFIGVNFLSDQFRFLGIGALGILTIVLFSWSLLEGLGFDMTLLTLILPLFFTVSVGLFWFLLPASLIVRIPAIIFFGLGIYGLCLTMNIYTVSAIRTIALLSTARVIGFILTLATFFFIYDTILSLRDPVYLVSPYVFLSSFPLFFQGYWSVVLDKGFSKEVLLISALSSLLVSEIALAMFFWPVSVVVGSLFLTVSVYVILGLGQAYMERRLFAQTVRDYLSIGIVVFIVMFFFATHWGG